MHASSPQRALAVSVTTIGGGGDRHRPSLRVKLTSQPRGGLLPGQTSSQCCPHPRISQWAEGGTPCQPEAAVSMHLMDERALPPPLGGTWVLGGGWPAAQGLQGRGLVGHRKLALVGRWGDILGPPRLVSRPGPSGHCSGSGKPRGLCARPGRLVAPLRREAAPLQRGLAAALQPRSWGRSAAARPGLSSPAQGPGDRLRPGEAGARRAVRGGRPAAAQHQLPRTGVVLAPTGAPLRRSHLRPAPSEAARARKPPSCPAPRRGAGGGRVGVRGAARTGAPRTAAGSLREVASSARCAALPGPRAPMYAFYSLLVYIFYTLFRKDAGEEGAGERRREQQPPPPQPPLAPGPGHPQVRGAPWAEEGGGVITAARGGRDARAQDTPALGG